MAVFDREFSTATEREAEHSLLCDMGSTNIYVPFRALGLVCDGLEGSKCAPFIYRRGLKTTITTPIDGARALHVYNMNLKLKAVSKPVPPSWLETIESSASRISALVVLDDITYAGFHSHIVLYRFMRPYTVWKAHSDLISHMIIVGQFLVTVSAAEHRVLTFRLPMNYKDKPSREPDIVSDVSLPLDFSVTSVCHPPTYLNKILLGAADGRCMLINLRSKTVVHTFSSFGAPVTTLSPSPVLDVAAVGLADGRVVLHNFKFDETIATYQHDVSEQVTGDVVKLASIRAISFRTDGSETMVTADKGGNLLNWDLNEKRMLSAALNVHEGGVAFAEFLESEPVLMTAGTSDNSLKAHIFDGPDGEARVLRSREGHRLPPTNVRFCGRSTNMMLSVGLDRELRLVSAVQDNKNKTFSQNSLSKLSSKTRKRIRAKKGIEVGARDSSVTGLLPVVTAIAASTSKIRDADFANVITAHADREQVYTWQSKSTRAFQHVLSPGPRPGKLRLALAALRDPPSKKKARKPEKLTVVENRTATCVAISPCGNFAVVGSQEGRVHIYNLQSGVHVGALEEPNDDTEQKLKTETWGYAHDGSVAAVSVDALSDILLTCGRKDKTVKYWKLRTRTRESGTFETPSEIVSLAWCKSSDLLAIACEDFNIYIYDGTSQKLAREFKGHHAPISDICFHGEGRRLVSSSMDGTLRTWDLPSGRSIDVMKCADAPTSVIVAPKSAYIATTHVNSLAVLLWIDQTKYLSLDAIKEHHSSSAELPSLDNVILSDGNSSNDSASTSHSDMDDSDEEEEKSGDVSLAPHLATLSGKPATQWTVLSNLNAIKERNKPLAPPKKPENVPFFLPTVKGLEMKFDLNEGVENESGVKVGDEENPNPLDGDSLNISKFGKLVTSGQFEKAASFLNSLKPSGVDFELRTMEGSAGLRAGAKYFLDQLSSFENFELKQAHLDVFLNAHGVQLAQLEEGNALLRGLLDAQKEAWEGLRQQLNAVIALSGHFAGHV